MKRPLGLFCVLFLLMVSCVGVETNDPKDAYEHWTGKEAGEDLTILNGKYWQSGHWTREYEVFLEIKANPNWVTDLIQSKQLQIKASSSLDLPDDAPDWFIPRLGLKVYEPSDYNQGSLYFVDVKTGYVLLYEVQL